MFFHSKPTCWYNNSHLRLSTFWVGTVRNRYTSWINQDILRALKNSISCFYNVEFTKPITLIIWLKKAGVFGEGYSRDIIPRNLQYTPDYSEEESEEESE